MVCKRQAGEQPLLVAGGAVPQLEKETGNREQSFSLLTEMVSSCIGDCLHNATSKLFLWNRNKEPVEAAELKVC